MNKSKRKQLFKKMRNNLAMLVMFILVILLCTHILHSSLVENTDRKSVV